MSMRQNVQIVHEDKNVLTVKSCCPNSTTNGTTGH